MDQEKIKKKILEFLRERQLGVISTINTDANSPQSAVVAFTETENLELVFGTSNTSRKYHNLQTNSHVSFVIGWDIGTIQFEGIVRELAGKEAETYAQLHGEKNPQTKQFMNQADQRYFMITPTWIRYFNHDENPPEKYEITF